MANRKISDLTALTAPASGDYLPIVDISEAVAADKNKRITIEELFRGVPLGTAAAPAIAIEGDENTGIYSPGADQLAISTGGTGRLFVGGSGVGVNAPQTLSQLSIGNQTSFGLSIQNPAGQASTIYFTRSSNATDGRAWIQADAEPTGFMAFGAGGSERLRITSAGNVGIGTTSPASELHIQGTLSGGQLLVATNQTNATVKYGTLGTVHYTNNEEPALSIGVLSSSTDNDVLIGGGLGEFNAATTIRFSTAANNTTTSGTERLRIDSNGRVGIGITTPTNYGANSNTVSINGTSGSFADFYFNGTRQGWIGTPGSNQMAIDTAGVGIPLTLKTNNNTALTIDTSQRVGIGTSSPSATLEVNGTLTTQGNIAAQSGGATRTLTLGPAGAGLEYNTDGTTYLGGRTDAYPLVFRTNSTERLRITSAGNVGIGTASPGRLLQVNGGSESPFISVIGPAGNGGGILFGDNASDSVGQLRYFHDVDAMIMTVNAAERVRIDSSGRVGIGTSSPAYSVDVGGKVFAKDGFRLGTGYSAIDVQTGASGLYLSGAEGATSHVFINPSGRVGIGTTSPNAPLEVVGSTNGDQLRLNHFGQFYRIGREGTGGLLEFYGAQSGFNGYIFSGANGERARIDSSGRLLVGTSTARTGFFNNAAGTRLQVEISEAGIGEASFVRNENGTTGAVAVFGKSRGTTSGSNTIVQSGDQLGAIDFQGADGGNFDTGARIEAVVDGTPGANDMPGRLVFSTTADGAASPTERMRIDSTGLVTLAGPGIKFPATQVASADPNTLDDYEEGTFTPTVVGLTTAGAGTYSTQSGKYIKVGGMVYVEVALNWSAHTGTGNMAFGGLPFNIPASANGSGISVGRTNNLAITAGYYLNGYANPNSALVILRAIPTGGGAENAVTLDTAAEINFSLTYSVV